MYAHYIYQICSRYRLLHFCFPETLQSKDENIAFFAYLSKDLTNPPAGTTVKFDEVETNLGHAYDPAHGVFAAPLNGSYHFQFIGAAPENRQAGHMMHLYIMRNGKRESYAFLDRNTDHWLQSSAVSVLHLARGDRIWVEITEAVGSHVLAGHRTADNATHTHFSGFLIHADWWICWMSEIKMLL